MDAKNEKLSATQPFNFRWGAALAEKVVTLQSDIAARGGKITPTEIIRDGLLGCWDEVRMHLLVRHTTPPAHAADVSRMVAICAKANEHGVTPEQIEAHLSQLICLNLAQPELGTNTGRPAGRNGAERRTA